MASSVPRPAAAPRRRSAGTARACAQTRLANPVDASLAPRGFGADPASARRAITAVFAGYTHARQTYGSVDEVMRRLDAIERRLSSLGA